jgi:hypothetical protein
MREKESTASFLKLSFGHPVGASDDIGRLTRPSFMGPTR